MTRRKLIFFTSADPRDDPGALFRAYHFANTAANKDLEAEVRLAGNAVDVTDVSILPDGNFGDDIRTMVRGAVDATFQVSL